MSEPLNILPEPAFEQLKPVLQDRLLRVGASIHAEEFADIFDPLMRQILRQGFIEAGAHEGTIWVVDGPGENLVPAYNTGPNSDKFVGKFKQPLNSGLICMVFASEQPFLENEVWQNAEQSKVLDSMLDVQTWAMIAVPFYFLQACRGVISCVQLKNAGSRSPDPPGFKPDHLASIQRAATLLSQLIEYRLLSRTVGWTS